MPIPTNKIALLTAKKVQTVNSALSTAKKISVFLPAIAISCYLYNENKKNSNEFGQAWHAQPSDSDSSLRPVKYRLPMRKM